MPKNTTGCLMPGVSKATDWVDDSRTAFNEIKTFINNKEKSTVKLNIINVINGADTGIGPGPINLPKTPSGKPIPIN